VRSTIVRAEDGQGVVLSLAGELDLDASSELRAALVEACDQRLGVVVDLAGVTFVDSSALGVLVGAARRLQADGCRLTVRSASSRVHAVLVMTGLDRLLDVEDEPAPETEDARTRS
jgi:anti-sigma B factor antagonist